MSGRFSSSSSSKSDAPDFLREDNVVQLRSEQVPKVEPKIRLWHRIFHPTYMSPIIISVGMLSSAMSGPLSGLIFYLQSVNPDTKNLIIDNRNIIIQYIHDQLLLRDKKYDIKEAARNKKIASLEYEVASLLRALDQRGGDPSSSTLNSNIFQTSVWIESASHTKMDVYLNQVMTRRLKRAHVKIANNRDSAKEIIIVASNDYDSQPMTANDMIYNIRILDNASGDQLFSGTLSTIARSGLAPIVPRLMTILYGIKISV